MNRFESLDCLRAFAVIGIVICHVLSNADLNLPENFLFQKFLPFGSEYVFLFMMLSAFSMCCAYYQKFKDRQVDLNTFYKRRYLRIWPFFALMVLIDVALGFSKESLIEAFADLTLFFGFLPNPDIHVIGVGWFLGLIFVFYAIFPFFVFLMDNKKSAWFVLALSIAMMYFASSYFSRPELVVRSVSKWSILFCMPMFVSGGIIYLYIDKIKKIPVLWALAIAVLTTALFFILGKDLFVFKMLVFASWLVFAIADSVRPAQWTLMKNKYVAFLSGVSMEVYLCHMMFFRAIEKTHILDAFSSGIVRFLVCLTLTLAGAIAFSFAVKKTIFRGIHR